MSEYGSIKAHLDGDALERLERRLSIAVSKVQPGTVRGSDALGVDEAVQVSSRTELKAVAREITQNSEEGVRIERQTESRPVIPLLRAAKVELPPTIKVDHEEMGYDFYEVQVIFSIFLSTDQFARTAWFELMLTDDVTDPARRLRPIRLFPDRKDLELFRVDVEGAVGLSADMSLSVPKAAGVVLPFGDVTADAKLKAGIVLSPLSFPFRNAEIEVIGEGGQAVKWRYNLRSALRGTNIFKSVLILKVAQEAKAVSMTASLGVTPCKPMWLVFEKDLPELPATETLIVELARKNGH
jgi:hypothetical protein